jgi:phosphatidylserine/phosphatidylglycerophosphate/cardiolipin synthase-like enzyme
MSGTSIIIEIPIEILHTVFRVEKEDPLKPLMDAMNSIKKVESTSQSVHRLDALSRSSSSISKVSEFSTPVVRDLWKGKYWSLAEKNLSLDGDLTGSLHRLEPIQRLDVNKPEGEVKELAAPFLGWLAGKSKIDRKDILRHVRLESLKSNSEVIFVRTKISQKEDRVGRKFWVYEEGPFKQLIGDHIDKERGFEMYEPEATEGIQEWPYSPEVIALRDLRKKMRRSSVAAAKRRGNNSDQKSKSAAEQLQYEVLKESQLILDSIRDRIKEDKRPRLNQVKQVVGFRQDLWDAAQEVINSSKKQVFVLSSFSNSKYADDVAEMLAEVSNGRDLELLLSFGEPDRGRSPDDIKNTQEYISKLSKDKRLNIKGGISAASNHSKVIISDTGVILISSCNLFSGSLESGVIESGLVINDAECAKSILDVISDEKWAPGALSAEFNELHSQVNSIKPIRHSPDLSDKISEISSNIKKEEYWYAIPKLERMLMEIAERPVWSLIRTIEHRPFMGDCIERFESRLVMASDGLRSNGLDKASIQRIGTRASEHEATVHVWWGRHAPKSQPFDAIDKRGRKEAKDRLTELRTLMNSQGKRKRWNLIPRSSNEPMETHSKMFIVDDIRLMITSDNTLSFGDTEVERGDAGELGIVIDSPRLALQTRGSMELWLPNDAVIPHDHTRWWALLAEEVSLSTENSFQKVSLMETLDSFIERIESSDWLKSRWEKEMESETDEMGVINKLALGVKFGLFSIAESEKSRGSKSRLSSEQLDGSLISLAIKKRWHIAINDLIDDALITALSQYKSKSGKRPHFIKQGGRDYRLSYKSKKLHMQFDEDFVIPYLEKHREKVLCEINSLFEFKLKVSWSLTKKGKEKHDFSNAFGVDEEITPEAWADSLLQFMTDPDIFEFISPPYNRMVASEPKLRLGKGMLAKFIAEECDEFLEWEKRKGQLYVRRRNS